jgi:hypothetical protein
MAWKTQDDPIFIWPYLSVLLENKFGLGHAVFTVGTFYSCFLDLSGYNFPPAAPFLVPFPIWSSHGQSVQMDSSSCRLFPDLSPLTFDPMCTRVSRVVCLLALHCTKSLCILPGVPTALMLADWKVGWLFICWDKKSCQGNKYSYWPKMFPLRHFLLWIQPFKSFL